MPNIALTKADGLVLNLPAGSITAVLSTALNPAPEGEMTLMRSVIISDFKGISTFALSHSAKDVLVQIDAGSGKGKRRQWISLTAGADDETSFERESIDGFEVAKKDKEKEGTVIIVHFRKHTGEPAHQIVNDTPENLALLEALMSERD